MNNRLEEAINLRIGLIKAYEAATKFDNTIYGLTFDHYNPGVENLKEFPLLEEWRQLAKAFEAVKDTIPKCEEEKRLPILVRETRDKAKFLYKRMLEEALAEIILCDDNVTVVDVDNSGLTIHAHNDSSYRSPYYSRYEIPDDVYQTLYENSVFSWESIQDKGIVKTAFDEFADENYGVMPALEFKYPRIFIQLNKSKRDMGYVY